MTNAITPTIVRVDITPDEGDEWSKPGWCVRPVWSGTDRTDGSGWILGNRRTAERLRTAVLAGAVFHNISVGTDVNGRTYVKATSRVMAKYANADLRRLGY